MRWREGKSRRQEIPTGKAKLITSGTLIGSRWGWRVMMLPCFMIIFPSPREITSVRGSYTFMHSVLINQSIILVTSHTHFHGSSVCVSRVSSHPGWSRIYKGTCSQLVLWGTRKHSRSRDVNLQVTYEQYETERYYPVVSTYSCPEGPGLESQPISGYSDVL
jgi:hypothetical protein